MLANKIRLSRAELVIVMRARAAELEAAMTELEAEFHKRPRRGSMSDRYCRVWNGTAYSTLLAYEAERYGDAPEPAIERLGNDLGKVWSLIVKLRDDPYECKSQKLIENWGKNPGVAWRDCNGINARQWRRETPDA
jgi:hypothetical protein